MFIAEAASIPSAQSPETVPFLSVVVADEPAAIEALTAALSARGVSPSDAASYASQTTQTWTDFREVNMTLRIAPQ